jgi:hypothetical protein
MIPNTEPGPPPRRHLTADGRWIVALSVIIVVCIALAIIVMVPSYIGVSPG